MPFRRLLLGLGLFPALALAEVHYTLAPEPANGCVRVSVSVDSPKTTESYRIPAWCPGFYFLLNYEKKIYDVRALDGQGQALAVDHAADSREWTVADPDGRPYRLIYRVQGDDPGLGFFATSVLPHTA